jgi:hypothetical protein
MKAEMQRVQPSGCISLPAGGWSSEGYEATEEVTRGSVHVRDSKKSRIKRM